MAPGMQTLPQVPQFFGSLSRFTHALPQVSGKVLGQPQVPPMQAASAWSALHRVPHAPQFSASAYKSAQTPSHSTGEVPVQPHRPFRQDSRRAALHCVPQAPQLATSDCRFTHASLQRSGAPAGQAQVPLTQVVPGAQAFPQVPQFLGSV